MTALLLNALQARSARVSIPATGAWLADVDIDLGPSGIVPSGRAVLTVGAETLVGTIDDRATGRMGTSARVQLVAGGGGWDKLVPALHLHNDFGVTSTAVYSVTAAAVGEVVVDDAPTALGSDYVRSAGAASRVFGGAAWHVDAAGITRVGLRAPTPLKAGASVLEWDPTTRRAILASDAVVWPGTRLDDPRFGSAFVRDVEQTFGPDGARVTAWCETGVSLTGAPPGSRLASALGALAREAVGIAYLRRYTYRVVEQGIDGRVTLQSASRAPVPEILSLVPIWPGVAGVAHTLAPSSRVTVAFVAGDPKFPIVVGFDPANPLPLETTVDAVRVAVGAGTAPVVLLTPALATWIAGVTLVVNGITPGSAPLPMDIASLKLFSE